MANTISSATITTGHWITVQSVLGDRSISQMARPAKCESFGASTNSPNTIANATRVQPTMASAISRRRMKPRVSDRWKATLRPHISVCIEPDSDHTPRTRPTSRITSPLWRALAIWVRLSDKSLNHLFGHDVVGLDDSHR